MVGGGEIMNIILLSGGSGKRLWPLSNETRSKQFLKLLKNEEGEYESMVQRVYRQIKTVCDESNIVVATGASQVDVIKGQLGDHVDVVIEPERRDTFPAIVLSTAYLALEKKLDMNEPVLVLPVDPYADLDYFYTLLQMEKAVKANVADMVLMGIRPTYPSEKYGYILPDENCDCQNHKENLAFPVKAFIEKPSEFQAVELIEGGAVWNGGIFAFKLGYLMSILSSYIHVNSFEELRSQYGTLKKTSFDYEVVERAKSVAMIPYDGEWKDLGTWNTLSEEMEEDSIGYVTLGEDTYGTSVINELSIPVVVLGVQDLIVATSPDGILISDKEKSSYLKSYVDKIKQRPMFEECRWGDYKVLDYKTYDDGRTSLTRNIFVKSGCNIGYKHHALRDEIWTIVDGSGTLTLEDHTRNVQTGDVVYIHKGQRHDLTAITNMNIIEVQIGLEVV